MKNISVNDYMSLHDQMLRSRHLNEAVNEAHLLDELSMMWPILSDDDQDEVKKIIEERAYQHNV
jgi:hypothetical protein